MSDLHSRKMTLGWMVVSQLKLPFNKEVAEKIVEICFPLDSDHPWKTDNVRKCLSEYIQSIFPMGEQVKGGWESWFLMLHRNFFNDDSVFCEAVVEMTGKTRLYFWSAESRANGVLVEGNH